MIYRFAEFDVYTAKREILGNGKALLAEPQVFDLLVLLVSNHHRHVTKDELIEKIWRGRIVSDSAISSRVKSLRQLLGDDGVTQKFIRTLRGNGFRFVGDVQIVAPQQAGQDSDVPDDPPVSADRAPAPSIAVLPFRMISGSESHATLAEALPREIIASLASLRWIKVIAHGSTFRFRGSGVDVAQVGALLGVRYCLTGSVEVSGNAVMIDVELADTTNNHVIWAQRKRATLDGIHELRADIVASVIAVAELEISQHISDLYTGADAENLDAWTAMHVGYQQMNQFNRHSNGVAETMFIKAIEREPTLARAHAGLAFVRFQNAFMRYETDFDRSGHLARRSAERALELQARDPFANFMMGRCHWLSGDPEGGKPWFDRAIQTSPSYALGYYGASWADIFTGNYDSGLQQTEQALLLSPLDPMRPGMTGGKMWVYIARKDYCKAVKWAEIAARSPGAHAGMACFAAMSHWLNADDAGCKQWIAEAKRRNPTQSYANLEPLVPRAHQDFYDLVKRFSEQLH